MSGYHALPKADEDLIEGARWIRADNPQAARRFLGAAFEAFDRLAEFPESGPMARLKNRRLANIRFCVLPPPFNRWVIFYRIIGGEVEINRLIYGTQNWRGKPGSFFI
ncbi:MAG TPA: type II toxin-antitoxin system RelE/ParE family toxin [Verrucomicrobiota bacterium]|nr:type II toxin-antitoxin system RelE/ParE family toxin [Verrucomicrobiota bacterium]